MVNSNKEETLKLIGEAMSREFSDEQLEIITSYGSPENVIACAGAGKTTVSIAKMLYQIIEFDMKPFEILSITFSKKAAQEIEDRYVKASEKLGFRGYSPIFKTFHAYFYSQVRLIPKYRSFTVTSPSEYKYQLSNLVTSYGTTSKSEVFDVYMSIRSALINFGVSIDGIVGVPNSPVFKDSGIDYFNYVDVVTAYNQEKEDKQQLDFDDMQILLLQELTNAGEESTIIKRFQSAYKMIILDEYQDISPIQSQIMNLLLSPEQVKSLVAIGDDDQSIYSFRGSNPSYIIDFLMLYPDAERRFISTNYRCGSNIIDSVAPMITNNSHRVDKQLKAFKQGGVVDYIDLDTKAGADKVLNMLKSDLLEGSDVGETAVLVFHNSQRLILADRLAEQGLPVDVLDSKWLLSRSKIYKELVEIVEMVKEHKGYLFAKHAYKFMPSVKRAGVEAYKNNRKSDWYNDIVLEGRYQLDSDILNAINKIHESENAFTCLYYAWKMLIENYKRLARKGYANLNTVGDLVSYILSLTADSQEKHTITWKIFLESEAIKRNNLLTLIGYENAFKINTIHSTKGLEFKKVFLYGLSDKILNSEEMLDYVTDIATETPDRLSSIALDIDSVLKVVLQYNTSVEETRRVFYVGATRAEEELYYCYHGKQPFVLLEELLKN